MTTFENWCALNNAQPLPAAPADVARFIADCAPLGIEKLWPLVQEISRAHYVTGLADPTLGGWAARAVNEVSKIDPPRSWPKEQKGRFLSMPYDLQNYVLAHDTQREKEIRRAHSTVAASRKKLTEMQKPAEANNGDTIENAATA